MVFSPNEQTGRMGPSNKHTYDVIPCTQVKDSGHSEAANQMLPGHTLGIAICIDFSSDPNFEHYSIKTSPKTSYFQEVFVHFFPCSLPDKTKCASPQEIGTTMFVMTRLDNYVVSTDKENPLRTIGDRYSSMLDLHNTKYKFLTVKEHKVIDDASLFAEPTLKLEFASPELSSSDTSSRSPMIRSCDAADVNSLNLGTCQQYLQFSYGAVPQLMIMRRSYKKLTGVMGEFGGVLKIFSSAIFFIYSIYRSWAIKKFFRKRLLESNQAGSHLGGQAVEEFIKTLGKGKNKKTKASKKKKDSEAFNNKASQDENLVKGMDDALTDLVKSRLNAVNILKLLNVLEALQEALFSEEESELLPLALLNLRRKRQNADKKNQKLKQKARIDATSRRLNFPKTAGNQGKAISYKKNALKQGQEIIEDESEALESEIDGFSHFQNVYQRLKSRRNQSKSFGEPIGDPDGDLQYSKKSSSNPIQEFIFSNVSELFSTIHEENEPQTALKSLKLKHCLLEDKQGDLEGKEATPKIPAQAEDLNFVFPDRENSQEFSSISPFTIKPASPLKAKRPKKTKKMSMLSRNSSSRDFNQVGWDHQSEKKLQRDQSPKKSSKKSIKNSLLRSRKRLKSKSSLRRNLD